MPSSWAVTITDTLLSTLLPLVIIVLVVSTAGKMPGKPQQDDMMPHGLMKQW
eukprot:CAMPEP_0174716738 /NCGR_PEP_ID=MMETSP1094-20130205/24565_1 /TAXON_ID=156173 /ORGANISM="Chrysochromulina brevifilum, Strain UTEX LB 985" /LENGTH=51 /DNA_ID=CAMNT_0015916555 /DNA_START=82 /DNA_END=234 /DNA_ORIENTATION=-